MSLRDGMCLRQGCAVRAGLSVLALTLAAPKALATSHLPLTAEGLTIATLGLTALVLVAGFTGFAALRYRKRLRNAQARFPKP